jgi:hypothetical protein
VEEKDRKRIGKGKLVLGKKNFYYLNFFTSHK